MSALIELPTTSINCLNYIANFQAFVVTIATAYRFLKSPYNPKKWHLGGGVFSTCDRYLHTKFLVYPNQKIKQIIAIYF